MLESSWCLFDAETVRESCQIDCPLVTVSAVVERNVG
jgi:hypothetical protein